MEGEHDAPPKPAVELGPKCPNCGEPWLRPTNLARALSLRLLPAPLRADVGLPELRRALDDRAHVLDRDPEVQPLRRQHAAAHMSTHAGADCVLGRSRAEHARSRVLARLALRAHGPGCRSTERRTSCSRPSILSADFGRLREQVGEVLAAGARVIHVDVMDGHFVPPITLGPVVVEAIAGQAREAGAMLDVHLMIERPERHVEDFVRAGADSITFHAEATPHVAYAASLDARARRVRRRRDQPRRRRSARSRRSATRSTWRSA